MHHLSYLQVEGTLSVQPQANPVKGFEEYFLGLTVENNARNPWFVGKKNFFHCLTYYKSLFIYSKKNFIKLLEFWEDHFQCRYPNSSITPYNNKYKKTCTKKEKLTKNNTAFEGQLQFVSDAVMAFAHALK